MGRNSTILRANLLASLALLFLVAGCGQGGCKYSSSFTVNNGSTSRKTITRRVNQVTRRIETTADVDVQDGKVTKFPPGALIKLEEKGGPVERQAELRENAGKLELWVNEKGTYRRGTADEEKWLDGFLKEITTK